MLTNTLNYSIFLLFLFSRRRKALRICSFTWFGAFVSNCAPHRRCRFINQTPWTPTNAKTKRDTKRPLKRIIWNFMCILCRSNDLLRIFTFVSFHKKLHCLLPFFPRKIECQFAKYVLSTERKTFWKSKLTLVINLDNLNMKPTCCALPTIDYLCIQCLMRSNDFKCNLQCKLVALRLINEWIKQLQQPFTDQH